MKPNLHIISFDIPFPANYGGVIDVFYKIRALHDAGVGIHLHCFEYRRLPATELEPYCLDVHYYPRTTGIMSNLSVKPYIVTSRINADLIGNLLRDHDPILFEGLHTCGIMTDQRLRGRFLIYRESNIEHHYYFHLMKAEKNIGKKFFFFIEGIRLRAFQKALRHASLMLTVSQEDTFYLQSKFPGKKIAYLPSFHRDNEVHILPGKGSYALYQGKLSVPENSTAAGFLIRNIWKNEFPELVIAGLDPPGWLIKSIQAKPNIRLVPNPSDDTMTRLIRNAHVNIMVTFQSTGLKLKLLNALFNGRFCLVNPTMVVGTSLADLCTLATTPGDFQEKLIGLFNEEFGEDKIQQRQSILNMYHSNKKNCKVLLNILTLAECSD